MKQTTPFILAIFVILFSTSVLAQAVAINPNPAYVGQSLTCTIPGTNPSLYVYSWQMNGQQQVPTGNVVSGIQHFQNWNCKVYIPPTAYTGTIFIGEASLQVSNSVPTAPVLTPTVCTGVENQTQINFTATSTDADGDALTYTYDFGDLTATSQIPNHVYLFNGTHPVTVTASDSYSTSAVSTINCIINDTYPVANFTQSVFTIEEGMFAGFTDYSTAYDGIASWAWDVNGDSVVDYNTQNTNTNVVGFSVTTAPGIDGDILVWNTFNELVDIPVYLNTTGNNVILGNGNNVDELIYAASATPGITNFEQNICSSTTVSDCEGMYILAVSAAGETRRFEVIIIDLVANTTDIRDLTNAVTYNNVPFTQNVPSNLDISGFMNISAVITPTSVTILNSMDAPIETMNNDLVYLENLNNEVLVAVGNQAYRIVSNGTALEVLNTTSERYLANGIYNVTLTVTDGDGSVNSTTRTVVVTDRAPVARFTQNTTNIIEGDSVEFTNLSSSYPDTIASFLWNFGDGSTSATVNPIHTYVQNGTYEVNLTVTDSDGSVNVSAPMTIVVNDTVPTAAIGIGAGDVFEGNLGLFTGSLSTGYDSPLAYTWRFANGTVFANTISPSYLFANNGTYLVNLTVTDADGSVATAVDTIFINDTTPVANFTASTYVAQPNQTINFTDLSTAYDQPLTYSWNFGDLSLIETTTNATHNYTADGNYTVTLTITDSDGSVNAMSQNVTVNTIFDNSAPIISAIVNTTTNQTATINWTTDMLSNSTIDYGLTTALGNNITDNSPVFNHSILLSPLQNGTTYFYNVTSCNVFNNCTTVGPFTFTTTQNPAAGNNAPVVTLTSPANAQILSSNNVTLSYLATDDTLTPLGCSLFVNGTLNQTNAAVANNTATSFNLTLLADGTYNWNVTCNDGFLTGNSSTLTFIVNTTAPAVHDVAISTTYVNTVNGIRLTNVTGGNDILADPANLTIGETYNIRYRTDNIGTVSETYDTLVNVYNQTNGIVYPNTHNHLTRPAGDQLSTDTNNWNTAGLAPGVYNITVNVTIVGFADTNITNNFVTRTINLVAPSAPINTAAPSIVNVTNSSITNQSVIISWNTNMSATGNLTVFGDGNYTTALGTTHSVPVTNLANGTTYNYNVTACNVFNNCTTVGPFTFTTTNIADTIAPATVTNLISTAVSNQSITWTWTNPIDTDFAQAILSLNGINVANITAPTATYTNNALQNNTAYTLTVNTVDISGNVNATAVSNLTITSQNTLPVPPTYMIVNSTINSVFYAGTNTTWANIDALTSITGSTIMPDTNFAADINLVNSTITNSNITNTFLTRVIATGSNITNSILVDSVITNCLVKGVFLNNINCLNSILDPPTPTSNLSGSTFVNAVVLNSNVTNSNVQNSNITNSNFNNITVSAGSVIDNSQGNGATIVAANVTGSTVTNGASVNGGTILNSTVNGGSLTNTNVTNSALTGVTATSSTFTNTTITTAMTFNNATVVNGNVVSGNVTIGGTTYSGTNTSLTYLTTGLTSGLSVHAGYPIGSDYAFDYTHNVNSNGTPHSCDFRDNGASWSTIANCAQSGTTVDYPITSGTHTISLVVTDKFGRTTTSSTTITIGGSSSSSSSSRGSSTISRITPVANDVLLVSNTYKWDPTKDVTFEKNLRPVDKVIFDYKGTSYSLIVDKIGSNDEVTLRVSPTEETRSGYKQDTFDFKIKDMQLLAIHEGVTKNPLEPQASVKVKLQLVQGTEKPTITEQVTQVVEKVKDGVIKVAGEIAPPADASVPVGVSITAATLVVGLLLFLGMRRILN